MTTMIRHSTRFGYDKRSWLDEGDRLLTSAKMLRSIRKRRSSSIRKAPRSKKLKYVLDADAAAYSSNLLIAYSVELYLKAGATALYRNCSKELFSKDVRKRYGHDLKKLARDVELPTGIKGRHANLARLEKVILFEGRYPVEEDTRDTHTRKWNERSMTFWSDDVFNHLLMLAKDVKGHVLKIDSDSSNPAHLYGYHMGTDGYFAFRCGGNLRPRITVKYSTEQRKARSNNRRALLRLIKAYSQDPLIPHHWDRAEFRVVKL